MSRKYPLSTYEESLTHFYFIFRRRLLANPKELGVTYAPLCWISGLWAVLSTILDGGQKIVCEYDPDLNIEILKKYKVIFPIGFLIYFPFTFVLF